LKRASLWIYLLIATILFSGTLLGACTQAAPAQVIEMKFASSNAPTHPQSVADLAFIEKIKKETGGRLVITPYWGGALMASADSLIELAKGVADFAEFSGAYVKEGYDFEKVMRILFYGVKDEKVARRVYDEIRAKYPQIDQEFSSVKVLARHVVSPYQLVTSTRAVRKIDDFKGLNLKTTGQFNQIALALGAQGTTVPMADTYVALQKGTVDGAFTPLETLKSFKFAEVIKYLTYINMAVGPTPHRGMNWDSYNKLPADIKGILDKNVLWWGQQIETNLLEADDEGVELAKQNKVEIIELSKADLAKYYEEVNKVCLAEMAKLDAKGLPGTAVYKDIRALIDKYK
jgi:TRAP-type C4-dicarboxylate transport system substrate-binding protein